MKTNIITINGINYKPVDKQPSRKTSRAFMRIAAISLMFGGMPSLGSNKQRPNVNIVEEYKLIQNKQSKLSKNDRDWVCRCFESNYEIIKENNI
jgi:hypothetical protein